MGLEAWLVLVVLVAVVAGMATERAPAAVVMLAGVIVLLAARVIDGGQAFVGFSNPAPITVAALYVLARGVEVSGALDRVTAGLLPVRGGGGHRRELARILVPTAGASAFLNNTPIVAMMMPVVSDWMMRTPTSVKPIEKRPPARVAPPKALARVPVSRPCALQSHHQCRIPEGSTEEGNGGLKVAMAKHFVG
jgi:di/tricarboxylate transporter